MAMKMRERPAESEAVLETLGKSHPAEVDAFTNFMSKAESGPALTSREKEVINMALSDFCSGELK